MTRTPRPDFLVIGAPKAGTTALHAALAQHPDVFVSSPKEPKYWLCDGAPPPAWCGPGDKHSQQEWIWRDDHYFPLFAPARADQVRGESTPFYLWSRGAHRRIAERLPDVRLVAVVRDPIDRAYSQLDAPVVRRPRAGGGLRDRLRRPGRPGPRGLGAVLALPRPGPVRRAARPPVSVRRPRAGPRPALPRPGRRAPLGGRPGEPLPRHPRGPGRRDPARQRAQLRAARLASAGARPGRAGRGPARAVRPAGGLAAGAPARSSRCSATAGRAPPAPRRRPAATGCRSRSSTTSTC